MKHSMTHEEAMNKLRHLCDQEGGVARLARKIGVHSTGLSHQLAGRRHINGRVAEFMGIELHREITVTYKSKDYEG